MLDLLHLIRYERDEHLRPLLYPPQSYFRVRPAEDPLLGDFGWWWPRNWSSLTPKTHLLLLTTNPKRFRASKRCRRSRSCCAADGKATSTSSMYAKTPGSWPVTSIRRWKVWAAFLSPNGIRRNSKRPKGVAIAVLGTSSAQTGTWWYPLTRSIFEKTWHPERSIARSWRCGMG